MKRRDFPDQRKSQPDTAVFPAPGLVHAEERLENALPVLLRNSEARICHAELNKPFIPSDGNGNGAIGTIVPDGVFREIEKHPVDQGVASDHPGIPLTFQ